MLDIIFPKVQLNIHSVRAPFKATIAENYIVTSNASPNFIRHITFDISGSPMIGHIYPGQSIGILPTGTQSNGRPHKLRLYSVSSGFLGEHDQSNMISTTVKRTIEELSSNELYLGVCSNYLANLNIGDTVYITGPSGKRFLLPCDPQKYQYIFFATGTGIAPFRGMIEDLNRLDVPPNIVLVFGCPYRTDYLYYDMFMQLQKKCDNFHYITCVSRESKTKYGEKCYVHTAIKTYPKLFSTMLNNDNTLIYICGVKGMEMGIYQQLWSLGMTQYFKPTVDISPTSSHDITLMKKLKPSDRCFVEVYE